MSNLIKALDLNRNVVIRACAGAGKTYALSTTTEEAYLIAETRKDYSSSGTEYSILTTATGSLWDAMEWDVDTWGGTTLIIDRQEIELGKEMFQLKYSNSVVSQGFTIFGWEMFIEPTEMNP